MKQLDRLTEAMISYYSGDAKQIQHLLKVHAFAALIGREEELAENTQLILECAAIVHDIGIKPAMEKYGKADGPLQEKEGVEPATAVMKTAGFDDNITDRVCWLVAHHHTYSPVDGIDHRILLEADYLVNHYEHGRSGDSAEAAMQGFFRTESGIRICKEMFGLK
ncbi:MAG: HD domain-containing protein [Clostridiaceae bacterium]|nr:HD domain-containing protein [Clostridiaceae bacterium]